MAIVTFDHEIFVQVISATPQELMYILFSLGTKLNTKKGFHTHQPPTLPQGALIPVVSIEEAKILKIG